nr:MAG TPA: hypothetical protein [Caudoviricetes sp.]
MRAIPKRIRNKFMSITIRYCRSRDSAFIPVDEAVYADLPKKYDIQIIIASLESDGLITNVLRPNMKDAQMFQLSTAGRCYFEALNDERWERLRNSIILPVVVSIITTVIGLYLIPYLIGQTQAWLGRSPAPSTESSPAEATAIDALPASPESHTGR